MYGQIHVCVKELVEEKFGEETWEKVLKQSELDQYDHFLVFHRYDDSITFQLVGAVCTILGADLPTVLEIFGGYFLKYCLRHGYDKMLKTLGGDFRAFIQNLDSLHSLLALTYKNIEAPSFRCETNPDGSLELHYYTIRPGLYPIVLGLVKAVAKDLYEQDADIQFVQKSQELIGGKTQEHATFHVVLLDTKESKKKETKALAKIKADFQPFFPAQFHISAEQFCNAFPYHLIFDHQLKIRQCGMMIQKLIKTSTGGKNLQDIFELTHPRMDMTIPNILMFINAVFMLQVRIQHTHRAKIKNNKATLTLKGQMMWLEDIKCMIFISSPRLSSLTELMEMNVYLADIPLYDVTRELVLLNQQRIAEIDIAKKLDETTIALRKTSEALEVEKKKTETLLYQMLPEKVANDLKNGRTVEAEKFESVTILFSDIVTFTNIAAACPAMAVVNMLNDMYFRFDNATTVHGVYKVETIGDAYMIVSGVPVKNPKNAQPVANFAMDMVTESAKVLSPATGKPLQIRVGFHTGPVVAGVVGKKMPRYCLFGDTVNTASRMESHGVPGRIHVSPTSFKPLSQSKEYLFRSRGEIDVKGKGRMHTYFLLGTKTRLIQEPDDECKSLPVIGDTDNQIQSGEPDSKPQTTNGQPAPQAQPQPTTQQKSGTCSVM